MVTLYYTRVLRNNMLTFFFFRNDMAIVALTSFSLLRDDIVSRTGSIGLFHAYSTNASRFPSTSETRMNNNWRTVFFLVPV